MSDQTERLLADARAHLLETYRQPAVVLERGEGCRVWDTEGRAYLDLYAGIAVSALGHAHPALVQAIAAQAGKLIHTANYFYNEPNVRAAAKLCALGKMDRVFFTNSGTEAIEGAMKLSRRFHFAQQNPTRLGLVATHNSFHGRTMGAVSLTGQPKYWEGFDAPIAHVSHVPYGDLDAMNRRVNDQTAAVFVEPVQGEGGVLPAPPGYLQGLRDLCDRVGALLVFDEIQTGIGRTGKFFAWHHEGVQPDIVCAAKGIAGGVPMGAFLVTERVSKALSPGTHGTTFGGNALASAAALAVFDALENSPLMAHVVAMGEHLLAGLSALVAKHPEVAVAARGRGLLCGIELAKHVDVRTVMDALRAKGVLVSTAGTSVIRFAPPLVVSRDELDEGLSALNDVLAVSMKALP
ncbi:MAG: acetylornithine transaminase [Deltaproteobacteria bacterium]|nr:acetylornithine transaminase [Deltaproteobacteria bacterium]